MTKQEIINAIKAHAQENYDNGWDFVVECYDDADIEKRVSWGIAPYSLPDALAEFAEMVGLRTEAMQEARDAGGADEEAAAWKQELAREAGMLHGVAAYNDAMGQSLDAPE
tara:strand:- start:664 stop:996 length:333 start_codon:yes stop_codon:yes gene_type:complete